MKKLLLKLFAGFATVVLLTAASCSSKATTSATNSTGSVTIVNTNVPLANQTVDLANTNATIIGSAAIVLFTASELKPSVVTIKIGQTVTWTNSDTIDHWPVSDSNPGLPGFDSLGLAPGESYSYTFTKAGTWKYFDHLHSAVKGTVIVE